MPKAAKDQASPQSRAVHARAARATKKRALFLQSLTETANVLQSCARAGLGRRTVYDYRDRDTGFAKAWDAALDRGTDALEDEAVRRAHDGVLKPVFQGGRKVGTIREYSDTLLIFLLKGRRPEKYRDRQELTGKDGGPIQTAATVQFYLPTNHREKKAS